MLRLLQGGCDRRILLPQARDNTPHLWPGTAIRLTQPGGWQGVVLALPDRPLRGVHEAALDGTPDLRQAGDAYLQLRCEVLYILSKQEPAQRIISIHPAKGVDWMSLPHIREISGRSQGNL
jgi:hypothetical protein